VTTSKRIVCLANSRKMSGRCVAGRELVHGKPGPWVRPVSGRPHQEVSATERRYEDGAEPRVLDIIAMPLARPEPHGYQAENWLLDAEWYWQRDGAIDPSALGPFVGPDAALWMSGYSSSSGTNDRIPQVMATAYNSSLRLIRVSDATLYVETNPYRGQFEKRLRVRFDYLGTSYGLRVTDPEIERLYASEPDGGCPLGSSYLTISLGEPFGDFVYKLVAAVIPAPAAVDPL
jgi:hypothetical protein